MKMLALQLPISFLSSTYRDKFFQDLWRNKALGLGCASDWHSYTSRHGCCLAGIESFVSSNLIWGIIMYLDTKLHSRDKVLSTTWVVPVILQSRRALGLSKGTIDSGEEGMGQIPWCWFLTWPLDSCFNPKEKSSSLPGVGIGYSDLKQCLFYASGDEFQYREWERSIFPSLAWNTIGVASLGVRREMETGLFKVVDSYFLGGVGLFPRWLSSKESACSSGDMGLNPGSGRFPREGRGNPIQCSCLENLMDRGAWWATVRRVAKSQTQLKQLCMHAHIAFEHVIVSLTWPLTSLHMTSRETTVIAHKLHVSSLMPLLRVIHLFLHCCKQVSAQKHSYLKSSPLEVGVGQAWSAAAHGVIKNQTRLSNWTELSIIS